jgi:hypothetical protein
MSKKPKKYILEKDTFDSFDILGIVTAQNDFRLALQLNEKYRIFFEKNLEPLEIPEKKSGKIVPFNYFSFSDPTDFVSYFLIRNKQDGHLLLAEKPSIDFFLVIQNNYKLEIQEILTDLRSMERIIAAFPFSSDEFALAEYLIFEN